MNELDAAKPIGHRVTIEGFDLPFWNIVGLLIKVSLAAIPAMLILAFMSAVILGVFGGIASGLTDIAAGTSNETVIDERP